VLRTLTGPINPNLTASVDMSAFSHSPLPLFFLRHPRLKNILKHLLPYPAAFRYFYIFVVQVLLEHNMNILPEGKAFI
jgi:hypothetical protein